MWQLLAILLGAILLFYWIAFYISVVAWLNAVGHLFRGNFTRAAAWFCIGVGMLFWWQGENTIPDPWDFHAWLTNSAWVVGIGVLATFARFYNRHQRAAQAVPPFEPAPFEPAPVVNININIDPRADRRAVHDDLAALASALRGAIGTEQAPRRISGPTVN
jgi:hypothetical protein